MSTESADDASAAVGERSTVDVDHRPARASSIAALVAAALSALTSAPFATYAIPLGIGGVVILAVGLFVREERAWVTFGATGLFLSVLVSGIDGTAVELLLVSATGAAVAWDAGQHAVSLGEQLGRHTRTWRNEAFHVSSSVVVAMVAAALGYGVYSAVGGVVPVGAATLLAVAVVFLAWAVRA